MEFIAFFLIIGSILWLINRKSNLSKPTREHKMEYRALRDVARNDPRVAAIIELLLQTGLRIGELARLELADLGEKEIQIRAFESHNARTVPLNEASKKALETYSINDISCYCLHLAHYWLPTPWMGLWWWTETFVLAGITVLFSA